LKIKTSKPECIWKSNTILGEGTLWVKSHNSIYFVDIKRKKIFILNTKNKKKKILKVNKEIGFLSHIKNNIFIKKIKLMESLSIKENAEIFDLLLVPSRVIGNEMINKINKI